MGYVVIPTRVDNVDLNSASDTNQLMDNDAYLKTQTDASAIISSGSGAPSSTPSKVGNLYVDTTNKILYAAAGTSSSADWIIQNKSGFLGGMYRTIDTAGTITAGDVMATRFMCFQSIVVSSMSVQSYTNTNNAKNKMAIYADHTDHSRPTGSPLASTGEFLCNGATDYTFTANLTSKIYLTAGNWYWLAFLSDTAITMMQYSLSARVSLAQYWATTYASGFPTISTQGPGWYGIIIAAHS